MKAATDASLSYARERTMLYLTPGDEPRTTLDFVHFDETLRYAGRGAEANNYLAQSLYKFDYGPAGDVPRPQQLLRRASTPMHFGGGSSRRFWPHMPRPAPFLRPFAARPHWILICNGGAICPVFLLATALK